MELNIFPYLEISKQNVKRKISTTLTDQRINEVARAAFDFHSKDRASRSFHAYYCEISSDPKASLSAANFFHKFKQRYSLQGIDRNHLNRLE